MCASEHTAADFCRSVDAMNIRKALAGAAFAAVAFTSLAAHAWKVQEDKGTTLLILCADSSNATVSFIAGYWTVASAGEHGAAGGRFSIAGQAALKGCGES
jgi:hypothetical protein